VNRAGEDPAGSKGGADRSGPTLDAPPRATFTAAAWKARFGRWRN